MTSHRVLFISGSLGLGHATRDLAIAAQMRRLRPDIDISWLAAPPATDLIRAAGETLLPDANDWAHETATAESTATGYSSSVLKYVIKAYDGMDRNAEVFERVTDRERFDVVIGDETYELWEPLMKRPDRLACPFVMIYDFVGFDSRNSGPIERIGSYYFNRMWVNADRRLFGAGRHLALFVGEVEDVAESRLGPLLPDRRSHAVEHYEFVGYALTFDPAAYESRHEVRRRLGYGDQPLVVVSVGGTSIGKALLDLCAQAFPLVREHSPGLQMRLVCGPRVSPESVHVPAGSDGLRVEGFIPRLFEHLAACDVAVVQAGGTTTLELTALRIPFLYFPLHGHFEQEVSVSERLKRHAAGTRMCFDETTPRSLASEILAHLGRASTARAIRLDGAARAARRIIQAAETNG